VNKHVRLRRYLTYNSTDPFVCYNSNIFYSKPFATFRHRVFFLTKKSGIYCIFPMKRGYCAVPPKTSWDTIFFFEDVISPSSTVDGDSTATLNDADTSTIGYYAGWWEMLQLVVVGMLVTYALHVLYRSIRYKQRAKWSSEVRQILFQITLATIIYYVN
jgi:hypothetical protein